MKRKMIEVAQKVVVLITADKLNTAECYVVCPYNQLDVVLTDGSIPANELVDYQKDGVIVD